MGPDMKVAAPPAAFIHRGARLYAATRSSFSAPRITILSPSSGNDRYNALASSQSACIRSTTLHSAGDKIGMAKSLGIIQQ